jgi:hypothetical protein
MADAAPAHLVTDARVHADGHSHIPHVVEVEVEGALQAQLRLLRKPLAALPARRRSGTAAQSPPAKL